jgi:hypothetical protein
MVTCETRIALNLSAFEYPNWDSAGVQSVMGFATVTGSSANCSASMPFAMPIAGKRSEALLSNEVTAYPQPRTGLGRKQRDIVVVVPQAGAAANRAFI